MEPSLMVGLLPRRALTGDGALPDGRATAPARVEWWMEPSLMVGLLPQRELTGEGVSRLTRGFRQLLY
jgi:hypothetical protein